MQPVSSHKQRYVIDASKPWHVAWWAERLGVSQDELVEAMLRVGTDAGAVTDFINHARKNEVH
jgi:hypothetical protein